MFQFITKSANVLFILGLIAFTLILVDIAKANDPLSIITSNEAALAQTSPTATVIDSTKPLVAAFSSIQEVGFSKWITTNLLLALLILIGMARAIIVLTPSREDDAFWNRYIYTPLRSIFLSLQMKEGILRWLIGLFKK